MADKQWQRLEQLFAQAVGLNAEQQATFIAQACGDDTGLADELRTLLAHDNAPDPLPAALTLAAGQVLAGQVDPMPGQRFPEGLPYLVMEYVDGQPIDRWCHERGLDTRARLKLFVQVCDAVDYAHRNLVVHRDLKPGNILVDVEDQPKLLDFGIAKLLAEADPQLTRSGEQVLTPSHAAPEQISGGAIGTATDVYALGVLLYDLLTGRRPHDGQADQSPVALARAIVETDPPQHRGDHRRQQQPPAGPAERTRPAAHARAAGARAGGRSGQHRADGAAQSARAALPQRPRAGR